MSKTKFQKKKSYVFIIIIVAAAAVAGFAIFNLLNIEGEYAKGRNLYQNMESYTKLAENTQAGQQTEKEAISVSGNIEAASSKEASSVDFSALQEINPDVVAWINIPETKINYPVTIGRDNQFYLTHSADLSSNKSGAIFLDMDNKADFSDENTVIYGHNMKDGSMFASLHDFENKEFFNNHPYIYIYTPEGASKYRIFSAYETGSQIQSLNSDSDITKDNIITLSTCVVGNDDKRYVLLAEKE